MRAPAVTSPRIRRAPSAPSRSAEQPVTRIRASRYGIGLLVLTLGVTSAATAHAAWADVRALVVQAESMTHGPAREKVLRRAYDLAQASVRANPNVSNEHLWLANAAGRLAQITSAKEQIRLAKVVRESAERAIALDSRNAAAYMTLGAWHYYVAEVSWIQRELARALFGEFPEATHEKAIEYLTLALGHNVENPVEVLYLRGCANAELDRDAAATADFRACVAGAARTEHEKKLQDRARRRLKR